MNSEEINYCKNELDTLKAGLQEKYEELLRIRETIKQTDETVADSLQEYTKQAYEERTGKVGGEFEKSLEALSTLINLVGKSTESALFADREIGDRMMK